MQPRTPDSLHNHTLALFPILHRMFSQRGSRTHLLRIPNLTIQVSSESHTWRKSCKVEKKTVSNSFLCEYEVLGRHFRTSHFRTRSSVVTSGPYGGNPELPRRPRGVRCFVANSEEACCLGQDVGFVWFVVLDKIYIPLRPYHQTCCLFIQHKKWSG